MEQQTKQGAADTSDVLAAELEAMGFAVQQNGDSLGLGGNVCAIESGDESKFFAIARLVTAGLAYRAAYGNCGSPRQQEAADAFDAALRALKARALSA